MLDLSAIDVLTTTRAVRRRLDLTRPVPREVVMECLRVATQAPSAGDRQAWRFVVVDDPDLRAAVGDEYRRAFAERRREAERSPASRPSRVEESAAYLAENLGSVPTLVIPCVAGGARPDTLPAQASLWGSIMPATWSFMLAARVHGLGTTLTTVHLRRAEAVGAALGIPADVVQAGLVPVAYALGDFRPARRRPVEEVVHWNGWG